MKHEIFMVFFFVGKCKSKTKHAKHFANVTNIGCKGKNDVEFSNMG
jgi:hypothetical protein